VICCNFLRHLWSMRRHAKDPAFLTGSIVPSRVPCGKLVHLVLSSWSSLCHPFLGRPFSCLHFWKTP
jgi:hypothetical protein